MRMRRISAIFILAVSAVISGCGNNFPTGHRHRVQIAGYKTVTVDEAEVCKVRHSSYDSDEVVVTLPMDTPVTIVGVQHADDELNDRLTWSDVKITVKAEYDGKTYKGWTYINNVSFKNFSLEGILKDAMNREPYANYIAGEVDGIDQALGMRLMEAMCERAWLNRDSDSKKTLCHLARTYLFAIGTYDAGSSDTTPLHLAAKCGDLEFFKEVYYWCKYNNIPIDCPDRVSADTPLIKAARNENSLIVAFLLEHGADMKRRNASGMTAKDFMLASSDAALKNLAVYSRNVADYGQTLASLSAEDMRDVPDGVCLNLPATVYVRYLKSGMAVQTADYDEFLNELSIWEVSGQGARPENQPVVFPFDGYVHTDDGSSLNLRDVPGLKGSVRGNASDGSPVVILDRDENPDDIDDIIDYWYRIRVGSVEGWCFGGYLSKKLPLMDRSLRYRRGVGEQVLLTQGDTTYALAGCALRVPTGKPVVVRSFEPLEVLDACDPAYVSFGDSAAYRYYLVKNADNACGIVSGRYLANGRIVSSCDAKIVFFLVDTKIDEDTVKTSVFMKNSSGKKCDEIDFMMNGNDGLEPDRYLFTNSRLNEIKAGTYTLSGRKLVFAEFSAQNRGNEYQSCRSKVFFSIEEHVAHYAFSFKYNEYQYRGANDEFADCYTGWDDDDPSSVTVIHYGRYYDECGGKCEYSNTDTFTRDKNDIFSYTLTNEEHSDELPGI
jgi:hypothetical protein